MVLKYRRLNVEGFEVWGYIESNNIRVEYLNTSNVVNKSIPVMGAVAEQYSHLNTIINPSSLDYFEGDVSVILVNEYAIITIDRAYILNDKGQTIEKI